MYLEFFNLADYPFRLTPDADFLYMSEAHKRAKAYMEYTVWNREGFVVITGEVGCGKTTLIHKLISELDPSVHVAKIFQTQLDEVDFLRAVLLEFGINPFQAKKVELIDMLNTFLAESFRNFRQLVLIVDDAHNLSFKALEEIRMLSGVETQKEKILHIVLVGQPQLNEILEAPEMEQLLQRVRLRFHLKALTEKGAAEYIAHRLRVACAERRDIFSTDAIPVIYKYTGGVPRLINTLCDTAMICAYVDSVEQVTAKVVQMAAEELQWLPYARRINARRLREYTMRGNGNASATPENERVLANIGGKLSQLEAMAPAMSLMSDRMASIELLLRNLVDVMTAEHRAAGSRKVVRLEKEQG